MRAVVLGSLILIMTAANLFGLYSAFLACRAIFFKSNLQLRFTVETIFLKKIEVFDYVAYRIIVEIFMTIAWENARLGQVR